MLEPHSDRSTLRAARALARAPIDDAAMRSAVEAARLRLARQSRGPQPGPARRPRRIFAGLGFAAAAAAALAFFLLDPLGLRAPHAFGAARWQDAARATMAYKGWVHARTTTPDSDSTRPGAATQPGEKPLWRRPSLRVTHWDTESGAIARETHVDGRRHVDMWLPSKRLRFEYDPRVNELRIARVAEATAARETEVPRANLAVTFPEWLDEYAATGHPSATVTETRDGPLTRYDLTASSAARPGEPPTVSVWVDPGTKLIRRRRHETPDGPVLTEFDYGPPALGDVYDAGVPRDAVVVDGRPDDDVERVIDRLHRRAVNGYGDGVGLLTEATVFPWHSDEPSKGHGQITIFARDGDRGVRARFAAMGFPRVEPDATPPGEPVLKHGMAQWPAGFPSPTFEDALAAVTDTFPLELNVVNGGDTWLGGVTRDMNGFEWKGRHGVAAQNLYRHGVGALVWPSREYTGLDVPGTRVTILRDPARPGLIGLRCDDPGDSEPLRSGGTKRRRVYWIDPSRDDMPVETVDADRPPATGEPRDFYRKMYVRHARLPDGRWYPAEWEHVTYRGGEPEEQGYKTVFRLSVLPERRLPDAWFAGPGRHHVHGG